jgi:hypothetical protein
LLHCLDNFLQSPLLSFVSVLVCDLPLEKSAIASLTRLNRQDDSWTTFPQPSSVPIQARQ